MIREILLAAALLPGLGPREVRTPVDARNWPWSALVVVQSPGVFRCTGFRIGPATIVTAAHCLYDPRVQHMVRPGSVHVLAGYQGGAYTSHKLVQKYRTAAGWRIEGRPGLDAAVLVLAEPILGRYLTFAEARAGQAAMLGGYERDRGEVLVADAACRVMETVADDARNALRRHSCAGTSGSSGAPLLIRDDAGEWAVAGLQVAARNGAVGGVAVPSATLEALAGSK